MVISQHRKEEKTVTTMPKLFFTLIKKWKRNKLENKDNANVNLRWCKGQGGREGVGPTKKSQFLTFHIIAKHVKAVGSFCFNEP